MPYITEEDRNDVVPYESGYRNVNTPGRLNFVITSEIDEYLQCKGVINYTNINEVVGVLECAKLELYRRIAGPYEDKKREENGDVYTIV